MRAFAFHSYEQTLTPKVWIRKHSGKDVVPLVLKTIEALKPVKDLMHTITADNGKECCKTLRNTEGITSFFLFL